MKDLWSQLKMTLDFVRNYPNNAWLVGGDFNEILKSSEKFGGNHINYNRASQF